MELVHVGRTHFILFLLFLETLQWKFRSQTCPFHSLACISCPGDWSLTKMPPYTEAIAKRWGGVAKPQKQFCFTVTISSHVKIGCKCTMNNGHSKSTHSYTDAPISNQVAVNPCTNIHDKSQKHNSGPDLLTFLKHLYHATCAFSVTCTHSNVCACIYTYICVICSLCAPSKKPRKSYSKAIPLCTNHVYRHK